MGLGKTKQADREAIGAARRAIDELYVDCRVVIGAEMKSDVTAPFESSQVLGRGGGPAIDLVVDPIDGSSLLAEGRSGAISVAAFSPRGSMWAPRPAVYMEKIVVNREVAAALVPECLDAPAAWTLALIARVKNKPVRDLTVFVLDRPRHQALIEEIRSAGARVMLKADGDIAGALLAAYPDDYVDVLLGVGGATEGIIAACAVKALRGAMLVRLAPQSESERERILAAGLDPKEIRSCDDLVTTNEVFFAATGITDGPLLAGVRYREHVIETQSVVLRGEFGTRRIINSTHQVDS
jgi:fructose-1,6-bisphosphatase II